MPDGEGPEKVVDGDGGLLRGLSYQSPPPYPRGGVSSRLRAKYQLSRGRGRDGLVEHEKVDWEKVRNMGWRATHSTIGGILLPMTKNA